MCYFITVGFFFSLHDRVNVCKLYKVIHSQNRNLSIVSLPLQVGNSGSTVCSGHWWSTERWGKLELFPTVELFSWVCLSFFLPTSWERGERQASLWKTLIPNFAVVWCSSTGWCRSLHVVFGSKAQSFTLQSSFCKCRFVQDNQERWGSSVPHKDRWAISSSLSH